MLGKIWFGLIAFGTAYAAVHSGADAVTTGTLNAARLAVETSLGLVGVMCLWLGLLKIAEQAGLVKALSGLLGPVVRRLFPDVPNGHPALASICLNIAANILGMGSAATPIGLKAMQELQELNRDPAEATRPMCTLVVLNTTGFTLVPASVVALRASVGSASPAATVGATMVAAFLATAAGLLLDRFLNE